MEHLLVPLLEELKGLEWFLSIIGIGIILILVNVITNFAIERQKERSTRQELVRRNLKPLLRASAELISRTSEILITHNQRMMEAIDVYGDANAIDRLRNLKPLLMNRHESTAYRLINYLAIANDFGRQTAETPSFRFLDRVEFFLGHKVPVALRGYLYGVELLSREVQEELAVSLLQNYKDARANDLSVGQFCELLKDQKYAPELFDAALRVFKVNAHLLKNDEEIDPTSKEWKHILALAQLTVYLIDLFHELGGDCQWEEHRLLLVSMIRHWNSRSIQRVYLYEPGDLSTENYLDTFPGKIVKPRLFEAWIGRLPGIRQSRIFFSRCAKRLILNLRGSRFHRRHYVKTITGKGVKVSGKVDDISLLWTEAFKTLHTRIRTHLQVHVIN